MDTITPQSPPNLRTRIPSATRPAQQPRLDSRDLFRGTHELIIDHQGQEYRLRLTRNDKLILNK